MIYRFLADVVTVLHGALLLFFVVGGFLAWKWRKLMWVVAGIALWNLTIVLLDFGCPVTATEKFFQRQGGEEPYQGGYIHHYLEGHLWPEGQTPWAERIGFALLLIAIVGYVVTGRRRKRRLAAERDPRDGSVGSPT
jgi:Protein of Unknown function (DUF2784)